MTLEDIREVFEHGFGVDFARQKQKALKLNSQSQTPDQV
jgi:hypothetical protein